MRASDPKHGTTAGAMQHYRDGEPPCEPCRDAKNRAHKLNKFRRDRGNPGLIPHSKVREVVEPWLAMGFTPTAVFRAAGSPRHYGGNAYNHGRQAMRGTYKALVNLTEEAFGDNDLVHADLTRRRIFSLRAAGHSLKDMPVNDRGIWRTATHITVRDARAVRDYFQANELKQGPNKNGASRARNQGHLPPLAWDDPGTLAWDGEPPPMPENKRPLRHHTDIDPVIVEQLLAGQPVDSSTRDEKREAMRRWLAAGKSEKSLCEQHGWKDGRYTPTPGEDAA